MLPGPFPEDVQQISIERLDPESSGVADQQHGSNPGYRLLRLLFVLAFLIVLSLALPWTVGRLWYSINRARLLAEYDVAGEMLNEESGEREGSDGASSQLQQVSQRIGPLVSQRVGPSVVHISTTDRGEGPSSRNLPRGFQDSNNFPSRGQGSGVVVDADGYILTNRHVVYESDTIKVKLSDGRSLEGTIVGVDTLTDLALLKVDARGLIPVEWGNSDKLKVGSFVWAVGSPFGLERSITFGILSAKHRSAQVGQYHQDFLQTDAAVNPGNSGGPLVDSSGKLVGINTAIMGETYQGISFAVPSNVAHDVYSRLLADGKVAEVMGVFGAAWSSRYPISSRDNEVHVFETLISGGIARAFSDLASRHPQVLSLTGKILNEASGGKADKKRLDLAWTIGDLTYVAEVKIVEHTHFHI